VPIHVYAHRVWVARWAWGCVSAGFVYKSIGVRQKCVPSTVPLIMRPVCAIFFGAACVQQELVEKERKQKEKMEAHMFITVKVQWVHA